MGSVKIPYYVVRGGRGYWQPATDMRAQGARPLACGEDGPEAWRKARIAYEAWKARQSAPEPARSAPRAGTLAAAFAEYRQTPEWAAKAVRTREEWERCWNLISPAFGPCRPSAVTLAQISGFRQAVERNVSLREAHRCVKVWRALWRVAAALKYCEREADPSLGVRNVEPKARSAAWAHPEVVRLAKTAWRAGYHGLAAVIAVAWDTSLSPVDVRGLTPAQREGDAFRVARAKTGREVVGTLGRRAARVLDAYTIELGVTIAPDAPIFRNRSGAPYSKDTLGDDFRDVRALAFGLAEKRTLADFRRSGVVEAVRGGAEFKDIGQKLGNTIASNQSLRQTYSPVVDLAAVRKTDDARKRARK